VNEALIERCSLNAGDELVVGDFRMRVQFGQSPQAGPGSSIVMSAANRREHHAEAGQTARAAPAQQTVAGFGAVFRVDAVATTLIVAPLTDHVHQSHADVQRELRLLERQIAQIPGTNVVIDLGQIEYAGSEVIGLVVSVCKQACDRGGKAAICNAEYRMQHVLGTMHLFDLWPYFETQQAALRFIEKDANRAAEHVLIESDTDPALGIATQPIDGAWLGTLFAVHHRNTTLIVEPLVKGHAFEYAKLHTESNALRRQLDHPDVHKLVLDLGQLDYLGSEVIGVIVSLARKITDRGGQAVMCNVNHKLRQSLHRMHLDKLWPIVESREDTLR
jgi:anti-anti-sigma factor